MIDIFDTTDEYSTIHKVESAVLRMHDINLSVLRDDQLHPTISGNKWRKLKYNLKQAKRDGIETIITFGGAFSNHIYATAAACKALQLSSVGIIRGEFDANNPTTNFARQCGMNLHFIDRTSYRENEASTAAKRIISEYSNSIIIPEGGSNQLAAVGLRELATTINTVSHDIIMVSAGTGATASGILRHLDSDKELWVFCSLKSSHLKSEILHNVPKIKWNQLKFIDGYHYGGYGKTTDDLISFINSFHQESNVPLDPIYNGKLIAGFFDLVTHHQVDTDQSYLWVHTGGLQGIAAYNYMASKRSKRQIIR